MVAHYDPETGAFVGAECLRKVDRELRYYRVSELRAPEGAHGIQAALEEAPMKKEHTL